MKMFIAAMWLLPCSVFAQTPAWKPEKPVELVIGAAPGGANDRVGRSIQRVLQDGKLVPGAVNVVNRQAAGSPSPWPI